MKKLNLNIQGARGICTLMVFFGHATGAYNIPWLQNHMNNPLRLLLDGHAAVIFFFVLSGYFYYTDKCITIKTVYLYNNQKSNTAYSFLLGINNHRCSTL